MWRFLNLGYLVRYLVYYIVKERQRREDREMKTFEKNASYQAKNYRTGETFTVTCTGWGLGKATFKDNNGNSYEGWVSDNATNYDRVAHCTRQRVTVTTRAA